MLPELACNVIYSDANSTMSIWHWGACMHSQNNIQQLCINLMLSTCTMQHDFEHLDSAQNKKKKTPNVSWQITYKTTLKPTNAQPPWFACNLVQHWRYTVHIARVRYREPEALASTHTRDLQCKHDALIDKSNRQSMDEAVI